MIVKKVEKFVTVSDKTNKGIVIDIKGSFGLFTLIAGLEKGKKTEYSFYTEEIDVLIGCLNEFKNVLNNKEAI